MFKKEIKLESFKKTKVKGKRKGKTWELIESMYAKHAFRIMNTSYWSAICLYKEGTTASCLLQILFTLYVIQLRGKHAGHICNPKLSLPFKFQASIGYGPSLFLSPFFICILYLHMYIICICILLINITMVSIMFICFYYWNVTDIWSTIRNFGGQLHPWRMLRSDLWC